MFKGSAKCHSHIGSTCNRFLKVCKSFMDTLGWQLILGHLILFTLADVNHVIMYIVKGW